MPDQRPRARGGACAPDQRRALCLWAQLGVRPRAPLGRSGLRGDRGDRDRRGLELFFAERNAIRACRRYGEDHPDRMGANWADANPHESFRAEVQGRRDNDWIVSGRFKTFNRGREGNVRARCVVENDRVVRFDAN